MNLPEHDAVVRAVVRTCRKCGADFNDVIVQHPYDGNEHTVTCDCGTEISFRSPVF
jgi:hypothetical protein